MPLKKELKQIYDQNRAYYDQTCLHGKMLLQKAFTERNIELLHISTRVKSFESFYEKISRKKYNEPFNDIQDICGIRVVCFYPNDLKLIAEIIRNTFVLNDVIDKLDGLDTDRFGYRSNHYIVKIQPESKKYNPLSKYSIEVQTRTILMHAWAHIQGRLEYKQEAHIPKKLKRRLNQLSALLELADEQFQRIKMEKDDLRLSFNTDKPTFDEFSELNIDTFMLFMEVYFSNKQGSFRYSKLLMVELLEKQIGFGKIIKNYELVLPFLSEIEHDIGVILKREEALKMMFMVADTSFIDVFERDELIISNESTIKKWHNIVSK